MCTLDLVQALVERPRLCQHQTGYYCTERDVFFNEHRNPTVNVHLHSVNYAWKWVGGKLLQLSLRHVQTGCGYSLGPKKNVASLGRAPVCAQMGCSSRIRPSFDQNSRPESAVEFNQSAALQLSCNPICHRISSTWRWWLSLPPGR